MILINGQSTGFTIGRYPDGTPAITANYDQLRSWYNRQGYLEIEWLYDHIDEFVTLSMITRYLQQVLSIDRIVLNMPYVPNGRMDRIESLNDIASMKYFAQMINELNFYRVNVLDPHSATIESAIKNVIKQYPTKYIKCAIENCSNIDLIFYPDQGSEKRYKTIHKNFNLPYLTAYKQRDWKTGKIEKLQILGDISTIKGKNILIIDDICSKGGTFLYAAKALKEYGAADIYLYITHCEKTILQGEMINSGLIKKIYTTNSIYRAGDHPLIEVFDIQKG